MFCRNEEWESDSSFDFDEESKPVIGLPHFCLAYYKDPEGKKTKFPFEICHIQGRLLYGFYLQETDRGEHIHEDEALWIKRKHFCYRIVVEHIIKRGTAGRGCKYYKFAHTK